MNNKLIVTQVATENINGKITLFKIPMERYLTLDEIGETIKAEVDRQIDYLKRESTGHTVSHATIIYPMIHTPFDDLNKNNQEWQEILQTERN